MKNIIVLLVLLFSVVSINAQGFRVKLDAIKFSLDETDWDSDWGDWEDLNVMATVNFDESRVRIMHDPEYDYALYGDAVTNDWIDEDGDDYLTLVSDALDQDGDKCILQLSSWTDYNIIIITVYYDDFAFKYKGGLW